MIDYDKWIKSVYFPNFMLDIFALGEAACKKKIEQWPKFVVRMMPQY